MASVYKRSYRRPDGQAAKCEKFTVEVKVGDSFRRMTAFADRKATEELGRKLERLASLCVVGEQPDVALARWIEGLPNAMRSKMAKWGLLTGRAAAATKPLDEHLNAYKQALRDGGASPRQKGPATRQHADLTYNRATAVLGAISAKHVGDVSAAEVMRYLAQRREGGLSVQSANHYLAAAKAFFAWLMRERIIAGSPLAHVPKLQVTDKARRHVRRALEADELSRLLASTHDAPTRYGMTGSERAMLYRLAVETGLRASELASLTRSSFTMDGPDPEVRLPCDDTKNRKGAAIPLRPVTVTMLRLFLASKLPHAKAFNMPRIPEVSRMFRADLADAKISYRDDANRVCDFHSLRVTFCTLLAAAGVPVKTLQTLARHSTPTLTLNTYTRTLHGSLSDAVAKLPDFDQPSREALRATGTDNATSRPKVTESTGGPTGGNPAQTSSTAINGVRADSSEGSDDIVTQVMAPQGDGNECCCTTVNNGEGGRLIVHPVYKSANGGFPRKPFVFIGLRAQSFGHRRSASHHVAPAPLEYLGSDRHDRDANATSWLAASPIYIGPGFDDCNAAYETSAAGDHDGEEKTEIEKRSHR